MLQCTAQKNLKLKVSIIRLVQKSKISGSPSIAKSPQMQLRLCLVGQIVVGPRRTDGRDDFLDEFDFRLDLLVPEGVLLLLGVL